MLPSQVKKGMYSLDEWIVNGETGTSAKTMWAAIKDAVIEEGNSPFRFDVPHDPDDFRRCYLFVKQCDVTEDQLEKVKEVFPWWAPFIDNWDELASMFDKRSAISLSAPNMYKWMQELVKESGELRCGPK